MEMGQFWSSTASDAAGVPHRFVVAGADFVDSARLLADTPHLQTGHPFLAWHQKPHQNYVFMRTWWTMALRRNGASATPPP